MEIEPKLGSGVESLSQQPCGLGRDATLSADQFVDALDRNPEVLGERHLALAEGDKELLEKDLAGMCGNAVLGLHGYPL
jgi:hypothetical protein